MIHPRRWFAQAGALDLRTLACSRNLGDMRAQVGKLPLSAAFVAKNVIYIT